ncbi:DNA-processing protein DprA [Microbacterium sp. GXF7504]
MSSVPSFEDLLAGVGPGGGLLGARGSDTAHRRAAAVVWGALAEPGDGVAGALRGSLGGNEAYDLVVAGDRVAEASAATGLDRRAVAEARARWLPRAVPGLLATALADAARVDATLLAPGDDDWPGALDDLGPHAPACLWVRGDVQALVRPSVAVVGARAATAYGEHVAGEFAAGIADAGAAVVSGAAYGIDGAAHRAVLAVGGTTVAFLAGGCDRLYPAGNGAMLERIVRTGAVVGEAPCGASPTKWRFLARNRLIAALSGATVVVEAGARSGSLNTAGHAAALGRPLGAVPGPVTSAASVGTHRLLREYDARCVTSAAEALELIGVGVPAPLELGGRTDDRTRVRDALSHRTARDVAVVASAAGLSIAETEAVLGMLLLEGAVEHGPGGWRLRPGG